LFGFAAVDATHTWFYFVLLFFVTRERKPEPTDRSNRKEPKIHSEIPSATFEQMRGLCDVITKVLEKALPNSRINRSGQSQTYETETYDGKTVSTSVCKSSTFRPSIPQHAAQPVSLLGRSAPPVPLHSQSASCFL
jgi:hypothetical protein